VPQSGAHPIDRNRQENSMFDFAAFKNGPARHLLQRAAGIDIGPLASWSEYSNVVYEHVSADDRVIDQLREAFGVFSSAEQVLLAACLYAADYSALADEMMGDATWQQLARVSGDHKLAVAAAVARID
jgi:hypothetical protein